MPYNHHYRPHGMYYSDVEPAYELPAECECHTRPHDDCVCVREADVEYWNSAANAVSSLIESGIDMGAINSAASLAGSANLWNSVYTDVSANSAYWNEVSSFSADLTAASAILNSAVNDLANKKFYVDQDTITGEGTQARPWGVSYKDQIDALIDQYESLTASTTPMSALQRVFMDSRDDILIKIAALSGGHIQNFEMILQLMGVLSNSANRPDIWMRDDAMDSTKAHTYNYHTELNRMFYSTYTGK